LTLVVVIVTGGARSLRDRNGRRFPSLLALGFAFAGQPMAAVPTCACPARAWTSRARIRVFSAGYSQSGGRGARRDPRRWAPCDEM